MKDKTMQLKVELGFKDGKPDLATTMINFEVAKKAYLDALAKERRLQSAAQFMEPPPGPTVSRSFLTPQKKLILSFDDKFLALEMIKKHGIEYTVDYFADNLDINDFIVREAITYLNKHTVIVSDGLVEKTVSNVFVHIVKDCRAQPRPLVECYYRFISENKVRELRQAIQEIEKNFKKDPTEELMRKMFPNLRGAPARTVPGK